MLRRLICCFALIALTLPGIGWAEGEYYGSHPADDIYVTQTKKHTCTLIATTMMLRNYSSCHGSPYIQVTESGVRKYAWVDGNGLCHNFTIGQVTVSCSADIRTCDDKKAYLIQALIDHPEGVVIYDTGAPHAIWLFGYDADSDTFYCADTTTSRGGQPIPLTESLIKGKTQDAKVNTIDKIWYVE